MNKDVAFGQYYPVDSVIHRLDPRTKLFCLVAYIAAIFTATDFVAIGVCAAFLLVAVLLSRVPLAKMLRAVRGILILILFTTALNILFYRGETVYWQYWIFTVSKEGLLFSAFLICRLILLVCCSSLLTYTTTPVALTDGIESVFHVHIIALIMNIALRTIPTLMDETERIMNAQKARGAPLEAKNPVKRIGAVVPVVIPLLVRALRLGEELGDAMDARCYMAGKKRTKYKKLRFHAGDAVAFLLGAALIAGVALLRVYAGLAI